MKSNIELILVLVTIAGILFLYCLFFIGEMKRLDLKIKDLTKKLLPFTKKGNNMSDSLGDRIKGYEKTFNYKYVKKAPLMIRVDGKAFHTFTKNMEKPFDHNMMSAMVQAALTTASNMQGFKVGYVQSDEATFCLTDYDTIETQGWFDYKLNKIVSISAATMSVAFNKHYPNPYSPVFDSRGFTIPKEDVINAFLWRAKDWERNSLQMYCRAHYSHRELHQKNFYQQHEMLHQKGLNWATDLTNQEKNGTFLINSEEGIIVCHDLEPKFETLNNKFGHMFE